MQLLDYYPHQVGGFFINPDANWNFRNMINPDTVIKESVKASRYNIGMKHYAPQYKNRTIIGSGRPDYIKPNQFVPIPNFRNMDNRDLRNLANAKNSYQNQMIGTISSLNQALNIRDSAKEEYMFTNPETKQVLEAAKNRFKFQFPRIVSKEEEYNEDVKKAFTTHVNPEGLLVNDLTEMPIAPSLGNIAVHRQNKIIINKSSENSYEKKKQEENNQLIEELNKEKNPREILESFLDLPYKDKFINDSDDEKFQEVVKLQDQNQKDEDERELLDFFNLPIEPEKVHAPNTGNLDELGNKIPERLIKPLGPPSDYYTADVINKYFKTNGKRKQSIGYASQEASVIRNKILNFQKKIGKAKSTAKEFHKRAYKNYLKDKAYTINKLVEYTETNSTQSGVQLLEDIRDKANSNYDNVDNPYQLGSGRGKSVKNILNSLGHPTNYQRLTDRITLLVGEMNAGNDSKKVKNELSQILNLLVSKNLLSQKISKNITKKYIL